MTENLPREEIEQIEAELHSWRVYTIEMDWTDRPPGAVYSLQNAPPGLSVSYGGIPEHIIQTTRQTDIPWLGDGTYFDDDLLQKFADRAESRLHRGLSWLTLDVFTKVTVDAVKGETRSWLRNGGSINFAAHADAADGEMERMLLNNIGVFEALGVSQLITPPKRAYILAPGRWALQPPYGHVFGTPWIRVTGWDSLSTQFSDTYGQSTPRQKALQDMAGTAARWLSAALASPTDHLQRFSFAFFGLEGLINQMGKKLEASTIDALAAELDIPLKTLAWPPNDRDAPPSRNLAFRFAVVTAALDKPNLSSAVEHFRPLAATRNSLVHGYAKADRDYQLDADRAVKMLQRYLSLTRDHFLGPEKIQDK